MRSGGKGKRGKKLCFIIVRRGRREENHKRGEESTRYSGIDYEKRGGDPAYSLSLGKRKGKKKEGGGKARG